MVSAVRIAHRLAASTMLLTGCYAGLAADGEDPDAATEGGEAQTDGSTGTETDTGGGPGPDADPPAPAGCGPSDVPLATLLRVNRDGYFNAVEEIFGASVLADLQTTLEAIPSAHAGQFRTELDLPTYAEVSAQFNAAYAIAGHVTADDAALGALAACLPSVPAGANVDTDPCLADFVETFGRRILRHPLTEEERARFASDYAVGGEHSVAEGAATVLTAMLIDPDFLYDRTVGEADGDVFELTPHETATKLARALWNSAPDEQLLAAADAGLDQDSLRAEAERMLDDPRARIALGGFFFDWLELELVPFPTEAAVADVDARAAMREAMGDSVKAFATATVLDAEGTYADLLLDRTAYIDDENLANVYGVSMSVGPVELPPDRAGLLTRSGFVATTTIEGTNAGHIIRRGARTSTFICRELQLPDDADFPNDPAEPGDTTTQGIRERFQAVTSEPACAACHVQLDGLGAPMGHYGALGEWIESEVVGEGIELPIDTEAEILIDGEFVTVDDPLSLSEVLAASVEGPTCLATNLARNILGREPTEEDSCLVGQLAIALSGDENGSTPVSVREALLSFVVSNRFRHMRTQ